MGRGAVYKGTPCPIVRSHRSLSEMEKHVLGRSIMIPKFSQSSSKAQFRPSLSRRSEQIEGTASMRKVGRP